jgi:chemotaxis family two-component system sensor kinase Cph1
MKAAPTSQGIEAARSALDLTICDREPIHIPGTIQPHGVLFVISASELNVLGVSANVSKHGAVEPNAILGRPLREFIDSPSFADVADASSQCADGTTRLIRVSLNGAHPTSWRAYIHNSSDHLLLEAKLPRPLAELEAADLFERYERATRRLQDAADTVMACQRLAEEVRRLTSYDRVKVYRFARDWSGEVIAEAKVDAMPSYLGLHFPASDIPVQARELYRCYPERHIPDVGYTPVPLIQVGADPVDLSGAMLRSVSPVHIEYLRNMSVGASMSISIVRQGRLWGLVACHHRTAHYVAPELRRASVLLAHVVSCQLGLLEESETIRRSAGVKAIEANVLRETLAGRDYREALLQHGSPLLDLLQAGGLVIRTGGSTITLGDVPSDEMIRDLLAWLSRREADVFETDHLSAHYPPASGHAEAAGMLAVPLGGMPDNQMVWFRPEIMRTVTWGGDPAKSAAASGEPDRLHPRRSFEAWVEQVRGRSRPWEQHERAAAQGLRDVVADIMLRHSLELEATNQRLVRSNDELESLAYVASHDLNDPLREIETFGSKLRGAFNKRVAPGADPAHWFDGIQASSRRLRVLIDDLARYSRLSRHAHPFGPYALDAVLQEVEADLELPIAATGAKIGAGPMPVLMCDPAQILQVLRNIITNALNYRHPGRPPIIDISATIRPGHNNFGLSGLPRLELRIADNGIGFDERHSERIFEPFQRLHSSDEHEGSGIGLAICRKIIDRHGGSVTAAGRPGAGSVFTIILPMRPLPEGFRGKEGFQGTRDLAAGSTSGVS